MKCTGTSPSTEPVPGRRMNPTRMFLMVGGGWGGVGGVEHLEETHTNVGIGCELQTDMPCQRFEPMSLTGRLLHLTSNLLLTMHIMFVLSCDHHLIILITVHSQCTIRL